MMLQEYARQHVLTCLIPVFFIAGAIAVFVSQASVLKYFGATANNILSYSVASVSGTVLAVCSCTVLPLFAGIYTRRASIGPVINVLAIVLTAKALGCKLGLARAVGAVAFSVIAGLLMAFIYRKDDASRTAGAIYMPDEDDKTRGIWQDALYMLVMVMILVCAALAKPAPGEGGLWAVIFAAKWYLTAALLIALAVMLMTWFTKEELVNWFNATRGLMKQIFPLLLAGVLVAGFLLGRPGYEAPIPERFIVALVGGNSLWANLFASVSGALMYFATLTEVPILQGFIGSGMGPGPALALLLAGPALSLPGMMTLAGIIGVRKTAVHCNRHGLWRGGRLTVKKCYQS